ncbi:MAG: cytochrome-c peroxidase, partial [Myxococcota bacterium]
LTPRPDLSNRYAESPPAIQFGRALFFDANLSPSADVSCATCHDPGLGFADGRKLSQGVGLTTRNAPSVLGTHFSPWLYWDGRADSQWAQAAGPIEAPNEMGSSRVFVARRVTTTHVAAYAQLFGPPPDLSDVSRFPPMARPTAPPSDPAFAAWQAMSEPDRQVVNRVFTNTLKAIAAYERRLVPTESAFDRYIDAVLAGDPSGADHLNEAQVRGLSTFLRKGQCTSCHNGPLLTDRAFHNLGLPFSGGYDAGRSIGAAQVLEHEFNCRSEWSDASECPELTYLDPSFPDFQQAFKTPSLRGVALTAPYMHHGELGDLAAVVSFYSELPGDAASNHRELTLQPLNLTPEEQAELVAFLLSLNGEPLPTSLITPPS